MAPDPRLVPPPDLVALEPDPTSLLADDAPVSVVGCGNWMIRADRVGPRVLAALGSRPSPEVELCDVGTTVLGLLDRLRGQELLILVDACAGCGEPGEVRVVVPRLIASSRPPSSHQIGPVDTLVVARELYPERLPRRLVFVQVETSGLAAAEEDAVCARAVAAVEREIERWRSARGRVAGAVAVA